MYNNYYVENLTPEEVLAYFRKSRTDDPSLTVEEVLAKHELKLTEWVNRNLSSPIPPENIYKELVSGESIADRAEFQKVLKRIESPKIKAVLVVDLSRLGRPDTAEIGLISKIFRYTNTCVITPERVFNVADDFEREMFETELKRGNFYLEATKKQLNRGREISSSMGNYIGSKPPYGYDKITVIEGKRKCPTLAINEEQANYLRMIFEWFVNENIGTQTIANRLNDMHVTPPMISVWRPDTIRDILDNPVYIGKVRWNQRKAILIVENGEFKRTRQKTSPNEVIFVDGRHEPLISEELFQMAQEKRGRSHRAPSKKRLCNPLASLLFCECGAAMCYRHSTRGNLKYRPPRLVCNKQLYCGTGSCSVEEMVEYVAVLLKDKIAEFEIEAKKGDDGSAKIQEKIIANLEKKLSDITARELSLWESQLDPDLSKRMPSHVFEALTDKLVREREDTELALARAKETITTPIDYQKKIVTFQKALDALLDDKVSVEEKNRLLKNCIRRIVYHRDAPTRLLGKGVGRQWVMANIELQVELTV